MTSKRGYKTKRIGNKLARLGMPVYDIADISNIVKSRQWNRQLGFKIGSTVFSDFSNDETSKIADSHLGAI